MLKSEIWPGESQTCNAQGIEEFTSLGRNCGNLYFLKPSLIFHAPRSMLVVRNCPELQRSRTKTVELQVLKTQSSSQLISLNISKSWILVSTPIMYE